MTSAEDIINLNSDITTDVQCKATPLKLNRFTYSLAYFALHIYAIFNMLTVGAYFSIYFVFFQFFNFIFFSVKSSPRSYSQTAIAPHQISDLQYIPIF